MQIKHLLVDFINQSGNEIRKKGIYGDLVGMYHSAKHGIGTAICALLVLALELDYYNFIFAFMLGNIDFILHYHIDWYKSNYGESNPNKKEFWNWLGLDQMLHQMTYILLALMLI
jgi:hypothetical protein